jgi:hypothetical protein
MKSVGQGSRGAGASIDAGLGDPGLFGEWKLSSKIPSPPGNASLFSRNVVASGVGKAGTAGGRELFQCMLEGVPGDISASSGWETDMFRLLALLKLEEEKFFRILFTEGEADRLAWLSSTSPCPCGSNGESNGRGSTGLTSAGGDIGRGGRALSLTLSPRLVSASDSLAAVDLASAEEASKLETGAVSLAVSILSCLCCCPDRRRLRTVCAADDGRGGGGSGRACDGGGMVGAELGEIPEKMTDSVTVDSGVLLAWVLDPIELCHVRFV